MKIFENKCVFLSSDLYSEAGTDGKESGLSLGKIGTSGKKCQSIMEILQGMGLLIQSSLWWLFMTQKH